MKIENRNTLRHKIGKLRKSISLVPKHLKTYEVQLLPGETIDQARRRLRDKGMKMPTRKLVVYLPADAERTLEKQAH